MAQPEQIIINMSQLQNQDEKQRILKLFPKKHLYTFSFLQLTFGFIAILFQVSFDNHRNFLLMKYQHSYHILD